MTEKTTIWVHGSNILFTNLDSGVTPSISPQGSTISYAGPNFATSGDAIVPIPTPSILLGRPVVATTVLLKFNTVNAQIGRISINDGLNLIQLPFSEPLTSTSIGGQEALVVTPPYAVQSGLALDIFFYIRGPPGSIEFVSVGIEFET